MKNLPFPEVYQSQEIGFVATSRNLKKYSAIYPCKGLYEVENFQRGEGVEHEKKL